MTFESSTDFTEGRSNCLDGPVSSKFLGSRIVKLGCPVKGVKYLHIAIAFHVAMQ